MRHAHQRGFLAEAIEHLAPGHAGLLGIVIGAHAELGIPALQRRMDHVPSDQRVLTRTADQHREMVDGVTGGGDELQFLAEGMIAFDDLLALGGNDRQHRVGDPRAKSGILLLLLGPVGELAVGHAREDQ